MLRFIFPSGVNVLAPRASSVVVALAAAAALVAGVAAAGGRSKAAREKQPTTSDAEAVEFFAAIADRRISVKLIPKNSTQAQVLIANQTRKPLDVRLPRAFAGMPILAQAGGGLGGGGSQAVGGGLGGGGLGGGGGFFNIPPQKTARLKVPCVCLEHGKSEPRPAIPYEIRPIEEFSSDAAVAELCTMLGEGQIGQRAAQAAAWHLANGMNWQALAAKEIVHLNGRREPYFSAAELFSGAAAATRAQDLARQRDGASSTD